MNMGSTTRIFGALAKKLVELELLSASTVSQLQEDAKKTGHPLAKHIVETNTLDSRTVTEVAAKAFGLEYVDLKVAYPLQATLELVSANLIKQHRVLPLSHTENRLTLAVASPSARHILNEIRFQTGMEIKPVLVEQDLLEKIIDNLFSDLDEALTSFGEIDLDELEDVEVEESDVNAENSSESNEEDDAPVVRFINKVLLDAIKKEASDIHFEPYEKEYRIRLRIDGVLHEIARPPAGLRSRLSSRIKVLSSLDLAERRVPQDGRMKLRISNTKVIDFRVSTCPTLHGEKVVLRILDPSSAKLGIEKLGYEPEQQAIFLDTIKRPYGMVLVTGPTGSGKTVSLYTALNILNNEERNISTAEDPAEITLTGINQVNVHPGIGLDFASCLRSFLRQDPDVIMVGEIRDLETAEIAIKAAQTGHMVLSTLHTNDAPKTLTRLVNMGVPAYNIAASVSLIIAQRLARRLCPHCKQPEELSREVLLAEGFTESELDQLQLYRANDDGCDQCTKGFKGRVGIYQVMPVTKAIGDIILTGGTAKDIEQQAQQEGVLNLRQAGLNKARAGLVSINEINRITVT